MLFELVRDNWLAICVAVFFIGVLLGIYEAATQRPVDQGWDDIPLQKPTERWLRRIDSTGSTSIQVRKKPLRVKK